MPATPPRLVAGGTIYPFRFVKMDASADDRCLQATANDPLIGVTYEGGKYSPLSDLVTDNPHAAAGDYVGLYGDGEQCLVEAGGTIVRGNKLKSDANGKAVAIATSGTTLQHYGAIALESASSGEKVRVYLLIGSERPAIA